MSQARWRGRGARSPRGCARPSTVASLASTSRCTRASARSGWAHTSAGSSTSSDTARRRDRDEPRSAIFELNAPGGSAMQESIVVGTDGSERAACAVQEAARLAEALGAHLHVVSAFEPLRGARIEGAPEGAAKVWGPPPDAQVETLLSEVCARIRLRDVQVTSHAVAEDPADALLQVAGEVDASLIVVGNKGMHGARRFVMGNVPNKVSHQARCNVLIVATDRA